MHAHTLAAAFQVVGSSCRCADAPYRHNTEDFAAYRPTSRRGFTGRGRSELDSRAGIRTRGYRPNMLDLAVTFTAGSFEYATNASLRLDGRDMLASWRS